MKLESEWIKTPLNTQEILVLLSDLEKIKSFMPEHGKGFSVGEDKKSCRIKMAGFPMEIQLKMQSTPLTQGYLALQSVGMQIDFCIEIRANDNSSVQVSFIGNKINPFVRPIIEPAVKKFLEALEKNIHRHFSGKNS